MKPIEPNLEPIFIQPDRPATSSTYLPSKLLPESRPIRWLTCDDCHKRFPLYPSSIKLIELPPGFAEAGFHCPHCNRWYHSYYTNAKLEAAREKLQKWHGLAGKSVQNARKYQKEKRKFQKLNGEVQAAASAANAVEKAKEDGDESL